MGAPINLGGVPAASSMLSGLSLGLSQLLGPGYEARVQAALALLGVRNVRAGVGCGVGVGYGFGVVGVFIEPHAAAAVAQASSAFVQRFVGPGAAPGAAAASTASPALAGPSSPLAGQSGGLLAPVARPGAPAGASDLADLRADNELLFRACVRQQAEISALQSAVQDLSAGLCRLDPRAAACRSRERRLRAAGDRD